MFHADKLLPAATPTRVRLIFGLILSALMEGSVFPAIAAPRFIATPLGTLGGLNSTALAVNSTGQVTGSAMTPTGQHHAFLWSAGKMTDIGTLGGTTSTGLGINAAGQVTGWARISTGDTRAFLYSAGSMIDLGTLGGTESNGWAISDDGKITGFASVPGDVALRAFLYSEGTMSELGSLGMQFSAGYGVNAHGQVTGAAYDHLGSRAFLYANGTMRDLGSLGGNETTARAINARGQITGGSRTVAGDYRAFVFADGMMSDLGQRGEGFAINDLGWVVGVTDLTRAFLYADGAAHDLTGLVVEGLASDEWLFSARGINNSSQIAVTGTKEGFAVQRAYRLDLVPVAVEYYNPVFDHYFVTASPLEIALIDAGTFPGWQRTGESFAVYPTSVPGTTEVCRFWSADSFSPMSSHFYSPLGSECEFLRRVPLVWLFEGVAFAMKLPDETGSCEPPTVPVYRVYNAAKGGTPNHRYTTNQSTRSAMITQGWTPEGLGSLGVLGCVLSP